MQTSLGELTNSVVLLIRCVKGYAKEGVSSGCQLGSWDSNGGPYGKGQAYAGNGFQPKARTQNVGLFWRKKLQAVGGPSMLGLEPPSTTKL